jgi:aminodeoxyfutalosine synthase
MRLEKLVCGELSDLLAKVRSGERLGRRDFLRMWNTQDLTGLGAVANFARERASGGHTAYRYRTHLNYAGRPSAFCPECDAQRQPGEPASAARSIAPAMDGDKTCPAGEMHITGGPGAGHGVEDLCALVKTIRGFNPQLRLRAFSWSELHAATERDEREPAGVLAALLGAGIDSLAGGMPGCLNPEGTDAGLTAIQSMELCIPWVRAAAELGLRSELAWVRADDDPETLVDTLLCIRELQDRWAVFETCAPLWIQPRSKGADTPMPTGVNQLRAIATARLFMDNIPRIQSPIAVFGESVALMAQWYGADDIGGIPFPDGPEAGTAGAPKAGSENVIELIRTAGREPIDLYAGA